MELAEHAVRLTPADDASGRHRRMIAAARAHLAGADVGRARSVAGELVATSAAGQARAEALVLLSDVEHAAGAGHERAIALRRDALREPALSQQLQAELHRWLGAMLDMTEAAVREMHARASLELAEQIDDDALRAAALAVLAVIRFNGANPDALALAEEAHELALAAGDPERRRGAAL
jgi:hypothetical protein